MHREQRINRCEGESTTFGSDTILRPCPQLLLRLSAEKERKRGVCTSQLVRVRVPARTDYSHPTQIWTI
jgi:hypothetical protein